VCCSRRLCSTRCGSERRQWLPLWSYCSDETSRVVWPSHCPPHTWTTRTSTEFCDDGRERVRRIVNASVLTCSSCACHFCCSWASGSVAWPPLSSYPCDERTMQRRVSDCRLFSCSRGDDTTTISPSSFSSSTPKTRSSSSTSGSGG
jgi:hypothetical protein